MTPIFARLVTKDGLGYCCVWAFFKKYKRTGMIAARLGVGRTTVKDHRRKFEAGCYQCEGKENCLKARGGLRRY